MGVMLVFGIIIAGLVLAGISLIAWIYDWDEDDDEWEDL